MSTKVAVPAVHTSSQSIKQARALLSWSPSKLSRKAGVSAATVRKCESGGRTRPASIASMRAALEAAGIIFVADGPYLASAPITYEAYARNGQARYRKLAQLVAEKYETAINAAGGMRLLMAPSREKALNSLRKKLADRGIPETDNLAVELKDLAGIQLVFLSEPDVRRFKQSGILGEIFDLDYDRTRIHYADARASDSTRQFTADHYVVRLKPDLAALPENADIAGLACEVQIHTVLEYAWSKMAHDITYKKPDVGKVGKEALDAIDTRLTNIMQNHIQPANFEFGKVQRDFDRLTAGKKLFDSRILDEIVAAPDNNVRNDLIDSFEETLLPLLVPNIADWFGDIRKSLLDAAAPARAAQVAPRVHVMTDGSTYPIGPGDEREGVIQRIVDILIELRYVDVGATFDALAELHRDGNDKERDAIIKAAGKLASYNLNVWPKAGPAVQMMLLDRVAKLAPQDQTALAPLLTEIYRLLLTSDMEGVTSTSEAATISMGAVPATPGILRVRAEAIDGLSAQLRATSDQNQRALIVRALLAATDLPSYGTSDALIIAVFADTGRIASFFAAEAARLGDDLNIKVENAIWDAYRRNVEFEPEGDGTEALRKARDDLTPVLLAYRDAVNTDREFVIVKSLSGYEAILPYEWDDLEAHYESARRRPYREARADEYLAALNARNAGRWPVIAERCANQDDTHGLQHFLRRAGETKPKIAEAWLAPMATSAASRFVPALLRGLAVGRPSAVKTFLKQSLDRAENIRAVLTFLHTAEPIEPDHVDRTVDAAYAGNDLYAIYLAFTLAMERTEALGPELARSVFLRGLAESIRRGIHNWELAAHRWKDSTLFEALTDDDLRAVLNVLIPAPRIEVALRLLADIVDRIPGDVVAFFQKRQAVEDGLRTGERGARVYDAVPYKLGKLAAKLALHMDMVLDHAFQWADPNSPLSEFKGPNFVAIVFESWTDDFAAALWRMYQTGDRGKRHFVTDVLNRYKGDTAFHPLVRDMVEAAGGDKKLLGDIMTVLSQTDMMWGEYGDANTYRAKAKQMEAWTGEARQSVKDFAERAIQDFENQAAAAQRAGEDRLAQRRLDHGEAPKRADDKNKIKDDNDEGDAAA